jgi:ammonium transporter, Amt family
MVIVTAAFLSLAYIYTHIDLAVQTPPNGPDIVVTHPGGTNGPKLDTGDTAWLLTSTALVLMMTIPGLALFYGGMVRKKNILATLMQSFSITCLVTVIWSCWATASPSPMAMPTSAISHRRSSLASLII